MSFFTALPVPPQVSQQLASLRTDIPQVKWMHEEDYHLTLKYLGTPDTETLAQLQPEFSNLRIEPLTINLTTLTVFKKPNLHVMVLTAEVSPELQTLHEAHEDIAITHGIEPHSFPSYIPHVTLASYAPELEYTLQNHMANQALKLPLSFTTPTVNLYASAGAHGTGIHRYSVIATL